MKKQIKFVYFDKKGSYSVGETDYYHCIEISVDRVDNYDGTVFVIGRRQISSKQGVVNIHGNVMSFYSSEAETLFELLKKILKK